MANPCFYTYKGKKYTYEEFATLLHDGELANLAKNGIIQGDFVNSMPEELKVTVNEKKENGDIVANANVSVGTEQVGEVGIKEKPTAEVAKTPSMEPAVKPKPSEGVVDVREKYSKFSDAELEGQLAELENSDIQEFSKVEKELELRERESVFDVPLSEANNQLNKLAERYKNSKTEGEPFVEKRDIRESKAVIEKYSNPEKISDKELMQDFSDALRGNPTTWYADGLQLRESANEASKRGITFEQLLEKTKQVYTKEGYDEKTAQGVVKMFLEPIFKNAKSENPKVKYAVEQIDKGVLNWSGDMGSPRVDLGISWADIRKGEADIKAGKENSVPAKRLIEALDKAKQEGGYHYKYGTGTKNARGRDFVTLEDVQRATNEVPLTDAEIAEINQNEEQLAKEYDDYFNSLDEKSQNEILENYENKINESAEIGKNAEIRESETNVSNEKTPSRKETRIKIADAKIDDFANALKDLLPKGADISGLKKQGLSQDDIIDIVAKGAKELAKTGIEIDEAIRQVISKLKEHFEDFNIDEKAVMEKHFSESREVFTPEQGKHSVLQRLSKGESPKREIDAINKADFNYDVRNQEKVNREAENFVKDVGIAEAYNAVKSGQIQKFDTAALIYNAILQQMPTEHDALIAKMTNAEDIMRAEEAYVNEFAQVSKDFSVLLTSLGQGVSVMNYIYNKNEAIRYDLGNQIQNYKNRNNGVIPKDVEEKFKKASKRLEEVNELITKKEQELADLESTVLVEEIEKAIKRKKQISSKTKAPLTESEQKRKRELSRKFFRANDITSFATILLDPEFREYLGLSFKEAKGNLENFTKRVLKEIGDAYKSHVDEMFKIANEVDKQSQNDSIKISKDGKVRIPKSVIEGLIEKGFKDINSISEEVLKLLQDKHPELTLRQIKESIVGYGRDVAKTKPDIEVEMGRLKRIGQLELEIEDLENGVKKIKNEKKQVQQSSKILDLKAKKRQLEDDLGITEEKRTERTKDYTKRRIAELRKRISEGDFSKREVKPVKQDSELRALRSEKLELQEVFAKEQYKIELKNRSTGRKLFDNIFDILNIKRIGLTTGEFSPMFVQGGALTVRNILRNPKQFLSDLKSMFKAIASPEYYKRTEQEIKTSDIFDIVRDSKLGIVETDTKQSAKEELFQHQILETIFDYGAEELSKMLKSGLTQKYGAEYANKFSDNTERIIKDYLLIIRPFERANNAYMNNLRFNRFKEGVRMLEKDGKNPIDNLEDYKRVASAINTLTGRSNLGKLEQYKQGLGLIFFSAKLMASTWQKINPMHYWALRDSENWKKPSVAQKMLFCDALTHYAFMASITLLMKYAYNSATDDDDEKATVELDPRSSDFMKFKVGNVRLDYFGTGLAPFVLLARIKTEEVKRADGEIVKMGDKNVKPLGGYIGQYFVNKLNPLSSGAFQYVNASEKEYEGEKFREDDWGRDFNYVEYMTDVMPIIYGTGEEVLKEQPNLFGSLIMIQAAFGVNPNVYGNEDKGVKNMPDKDKEGNPTEKKGSNLKMPSLPKMPELPKLP